MSYVVQEAQEVLKVTPPGFLNHIGHRAHRPLITLIQLHKGFNHQTFIENERSNMINLHMDFSADIDQSLGTLRSGGIILYPTDTIWGIGCDATRADAVQRIFSLKQRSEKKSMIVLLADPKDINRYTSQPHPGIFQFLKDQTRPTTVIYDGVINLAENLSEDGTIGIRVVQDDFCRQLIKRFRKPIVSTSANISGEPSPGSFDEITVQVKKGVDYIVRYRQEDKSTHQPSSIVKYNKDKTVTVIR
jgi:L-threonylcarbamoyladenylate synthase